MATSWSELIDQLFPNDRNSLELSEVLRNRFRNGELNLVIACDKVPLGLPEIVAGVSSQSTLGFELDLVEVMPFVVDADDSSPEIIFVPTPRISTQIVSRTAVTVTYREGERQPTTTVETTSLENIEENLAVVRRPDGAVGKVWTAAEVEEAVRQSENQVVLDLFQFAKDQSDNRRFVPTGARKTPNFGLFLSTTLPDGQQRVRMVYGYALGWNAIFLYLKSIAEMVPPSTYEEFRRRVQGLFGNAINPDAKWPGISLDLVGSRLSDFKELMRWLKDQVSNSTGPTP